MSTNCDRCGTSNSRANNFCSLCGAKLETQASSNRSTWIGIAVIAGLGCILYIGAFIHSNRMQPSQRLNKSQGTVTGNLNASDHATPSDLTPARRLAAAKETLNNPPSDYNFTVARNHLTAIPQSAAEYKEAQRTLKALPAAEARMRDNSPAPESSIEQDNTQ